MKNARKSVGLIVNPIAGMGGAVGLKGTDGEKTLNEAVSLGAKPKAPGRAEVFLSHLKQSEGDLFLFVGAGTMGELEAENMGFECEPIGKEKKKTTSEDTKYIAQNMMDCGIELLVFCGGDGTARDIMDAVDRRIPTLGVPTGVKMQSAVFALNPESASRIASKYIAGELSLKEAEVMDVDEKAFRKNRLSAKLHGYMLIPYEPTLIQRAKIGTPSEENELRNQAAIALYFIDEIMDADTVYILGPGTTTRTITDLLDKKKTLLGVDLLLNREIISQDANEEKILENIRKRKTKIVVTPIGGQGFIFGRGNQQISPLVIEKVGLENIIVVATKSKLSLLRKLRVDTGNENLDRKFRGYIKVIADYREEYMAPVE